MFNFNNFTPKQFDKHIEKSIPRFSDLTEKIIKYSEYFIQEYTNVYDLGCSSGALIKRMPVFTGTQYIGIDVCDMLPATNLPFIFRKGNLANSDISESSFITSVFTLQFLTEFTRKIVLKKVKEGLKTGGAFLVCEKVRSQSAQFQDMHNSLFYEAKRKEFSSFNILNKEEELRSCMRIKTMNQLMRELDLIGQCEIIWKNFNFVAILVIKD